MASTGQDSPLRRLETGQFRLLLVQPDKDETKPPVFHIEHHQFNSQSRPQYIALSYRWNEDVFDPTGNLDMEGKSISIGYRKRFPRRRTLTSLNVQPSLAAALQEVCWRWRNRTVGFPMKGKLRLWVDSLCIDQTPGTREKSQQVQMMTEIYAQAACVFAWLGKEQDRQISITAHRWIYELTMQFMHFMKPKGGMAQLDTDNFKQFVRLHPETWPDHSTDNVIFWKAVEKLFNKSFWSRAWIAQEVYAPTDVFFFWGEIWIKEVYLKLLIRLLEVFTQFERFTTRIDIDCRFLTKITHLRDWRFKPEKQNYHPTVALDMLRHCDCAWAGDKVFAIAGLVYGGSIEVDYLLHPADVYITLVKRLAKANGIEHLLCFATRSASQTTSFGDWKNDRTLPSWVPDWRVREFRPSLSAFKRQPFYTAGYVPFSDAICREQRTSTGNVLWINGAQMDSIVAISPMCPTQKVGPFVRCLRKWQAWLGTERWSGPYHQTGESFETAFGRTIVGDVCEQRWAIGEPSAEGLDDFWDLQKRSGCADLNRLDLSYKDLDDDELQRRSVLLSRLRICYMSRICITERGLIGLVPGETKEGDYVSLFLDFGPCYILRPRPPTGSPEKIGNYEFIGEAYVHGIMDGEAWNDYGIEEDMLEALGLN